jgi:hypothetical protein
MPEGVQSVHETHRKAAEQHELAARSHRTAAEHMKKGISEPQFGIRSERYSNHAYILMKEARNKSGEIESL